MSFWFQETPHGAVGCWMTNRSKPVLAGMPCRLTFMMSFSAVGVMVTCPPAFGRHDVMAEDDGLSANENDDAAADRACAPPVAAPAVAVRLSAAATVPVATTATAFAAVGARMLRIVDRVLLMTGSPVTWGRPPPPVLPGPAGRRAKVVSRRGTTGRPRTFNPLGGFFARSYPWRGGPHYHPAGARGHGARRRERCDGDPRAGWGRRRPGRHRAVRRRADPRRERARAGPPARSPVQRALT